MPVRVERNGVEKMGEEGEEKKKVEKLLKLYLNRTDRVGMEEGIDYLKILYISLTDNERKIMESCIEKSKEINIPKVPLFKKILIEDLKNYLSYINGVHKEIYSGKTTFERNKTLLENQSILKITEEAFKKWQERENKLGKASGKEREAMWVEEKNGVEIKGEKKRIARYLEAGGNPEEVGHLIEAIQRREKEEEEINKKLANMKQGGKEAKEEEKKLGEPVVFLGDVEASTKNLLKSWLTEKLNREEVEEDVEGTRANVRFAERIIKEVEKEEVGEKK